MSELIWFNGEIMPLSEARVSVEDRGLQFADGVYEAIRLYGGKPFSLMPHLERFERSADGLKLAVPLDTSALAAEMLRLIGQSGVRGDGVLYVQLTRGPAPRNHLLPTSAKPTLFFYARPLPQIVPPDRHDGYSIWSVRDERWRKCWIKAICLTASMLARNEAAEHGADEAVFVDDAGIVAEGASSNLFVVKNGRLLTHPVGSRVLGGITRALVLRCANEIGVPVEEAPIDVRDAKSADEVFLTSTTREIMWVKRWDDAPIAPGHCGPVTLRLHQALQPLIRADLGG